MHDNDNYSNELIVTAILYFHFITSLLVWAAGQYLGVRLTGVLESCLKLLILNYSS